MSAGLHYAARKEAEKAYATSYDKSKSDAVKQQLASRLHATPSATRLAAFGFTACNCPNSASTG